MPTLFYALLGVIQKPPTLQIGHTYASITTPNATSLTFSVVVAEDLRGLRSIALDVSTPNSPRYGKHLTSAQISALARPDPSDVASVRNWLTHPQANVRENGSLFTVTTTVAVAEAILQTLFERVTGLGRSARLRTGSTAPPGGIRLPGSGRRGLESCSSAYRSS